MLPVGERLLNRILLFFAVLSTGVTVGLMILHWDTLITHLGLESAQPSIPNFKTDLAAELKMNLKRREELFHIVIGTCLSVLCVILFAARKNIYHRENLGVVSGLVTLVFMLSMVAVCYLATVYVENHDMDLIINRAADVQTFIDNHTEECKKKGDPVPLFIPTGMFIQSIEFTGSNNCIITGYVWQRYPLKDTTVARGFLIPEAQEQEINEAYHKVYGDEELIGWNIKATVREIFDFSHYPFDDQNLWIRLWHKEFEKNIMLVPDIQAYPKYAPTTLPGIEKQIVMPGWHIYSSFFGYKLNDYNSNFGMPDYVGMDDFPEMYFNIFIQRDFISIFISDMVPVLMVVLVLYLALLVMHREDSESDFFEFNVMEVVSFIATLIFVVILAQIELRSKITTDTILYIEYYYFVVYFLLFTVLGNYLLFHKNVNISLITHNNNYLPKVLFLPVFGLLVFVITVCIFY